MMSLACVCSKHTLIVVASLMVAHIGMFVFMYMLLQQQNASVAGG
jgi:hypothetical protein